MQKHFKVSSFPFEVKALVCNHPAPYIHNPLKKVRYEKPYRLLCYCKNYESDPVFLNASAKIFAKYLNPDKEILVISSREDKIVREQSFQFIRQLKRLKIPYDFYFEKRKDCPHVYNVMTPFKDNAKKCNDYIEAFIRKHI